MSDIIWPNNTTDIIDQIRGAIGRDVTFYVVESSTVCPTCGVDPVTNSALNSFCPTCSGVGYLYTYSGVTVSGHITWGYSEMLGWVQGGQLAQGDCRVQVKYTIANIDAIDNAKWVEVDGREMQIVRKTLRGVPQINRVLVDLIEKERE